MRVSEIKSLDELIQHPRCTKFITEAAGRASTGMSAEEFVKLMPITTRLGANLGKTFSEKFGFKSNTYKMTKVPSYYGYVVLGLLCSIAEQGFTLKQLSASRVSEGCFIVADIPSSPLSWEGKIAAQREEGSAVDCSCFMEKG